MFHEDLHQRQKDIAEVTSIREGQPMQSMDEQPLWRPIDQQPTHNQFNREGQEEQAPRNMQEPQLEREMGQAGEYQAASERPLFAYPPTPTTYPSAPAAYPSGATQPPPVSTPGATWAYPSQSEQYHGQPGVGMQSGPFAGPPTAAPGFSYQAAAPLAPGVQPRRSGLRTGALLALLALLAVVFGVGLFAGWQFGRTGTGSTITSPSSFQPGNNAPVNVPQLTGNNADTVREAVINKVQPGIVQIDVVSASQHALGSGVIIDGRGYIVTNNHVVAKATSIQVTLADGSTLLAQIIGTDPADDLAVIKITPPSTGLSVVNLADSSQLRVGQEVLAIGSPLGNAETVTSGIVSALSRTISEGQNGPTIPDAVQTDAPINPGNSGGALVDLQGNLVGIPTLNAIDTEFNTPANGLGFAIPANRVKFIVQQLIANGHVTHTGRSIVGVGVTTVDQNIATRDHLATTSGVLVGSVTPGGPAALATLKTGDVIVQLSDKIIHNTSDLSRVLVQHTPGEKVALKIYRGSEQLTFDVTLGELPAS